MAHRIQNILHKKKKNPSNDLKKKNPLKRTLKAPKFAFQYLSTISSWHMALAVFPDKKGTRTSILQKSRVKPFSFSRKKRRKPVNYSLKSRLNVELVSVWRPSYQLRVKKLLNKKTPRPPTAASVKMREPLTGSASSIKIFLFGLTCLDLSPMLSRTTLLRLSNWCISCRWPRVIPVIWFKTHVLIVNHNLIKIKPTNTNLCTYLFH